jgi:protein-S-isoprenylcysteine O-methyltransferase Ste14
MPPDLHQYIADAWIAVIIVWTIGAFNTKRSVRRQSSRSRFLQIGVALLAAEIFARSNRYFPTLANRFVPATNATAWTGLLLTYAGIAFVIAARVYLGRNWSGTVTVKQDHTLIRGGPYSVVRHPIYSGFLLAGLGTAIYYGQIRDLCAIAVAVVVLLQKIHLEEQFMTDQFGDEYQRYKREVKGLIPFVI